MYQVAEHRCWNCGVACQSNQDLRNHLHETVNIEAINPFLDDERYLKPFMKDDSLLYNFGEDEEGEDDYAAPIDKEEMIRDLKNYEEISIDDDHADSCDKSGMKVLSASNDKSSVISREHTGSSGGKLKETHLRASFPTVMAKEIKNVNDNYFGAYSSFSIHREMINDKVLTPSVMSGGVKFICINFCLGKGFLGKKLPAMFTHV